jgi:hypothetical protein
MKNKDFVYPLLILLLFPVFLSSQVKEIPIEKALASNAEKVKVKLGAAVLNKTFPIKIGSFEMKKVPRKKSFDPDSKFMGIPVENNYTSTFATTMVDKKGGTIWIEAAQNINSEEVFALELNRYITIGQDSLISDSNISSVFINTSEQKEDQWLLLMSKTEGTYEFPIKNMSLRNRSQKITFAIKDTEPYGSIISESSKGIECYLDGNPIAALQYKTGGGFGSKQIAWISNDNSKHLKMIVTAAFASILQLTEGGMVYYFTE